MSCYPSFSLSSHQHSLSDLTLPAISQTNPQTTYLPIYSFYCFPYSIHLHIYYLSYYSNYLSFLLQSIPPYPSSLYFYCQPTFYQFFVFVILAFLPISSIICPQLFSYQPALLFKLLQS